MDCGVPSRKQGTKVRYIGRVRYITNTVWPKLLCDLMLPSIVFYVPEGTVEFKMQQKSYYSLDCPVLFYTKHEKVYERVHSTYLCHCQHLMHIFPLRPNS